MIRIAVRRDRQRMARPAQIPHEPEHLGLTQEFETYQRDLGKLVRDAGKYVLIHQTEIVGIYETYAEAFEEGYGKFALDPFLVMHIAAKPILAR